MTQKKSDFLGKIIKIQVVSRGRNGDPFGKIDGKIVFIKLKPGEILKSNLVDVMITKNFDSMAYGVIVNYDNFGKLVL